jgi:hypothetical protein
LPINSEHISYAEHSTKARRVRDAVAGEYAVHKAGDLYLPKLKDQSSDDYDAYVKRASYFNATGRTLDGLVGMVFRKNATIEQTGIDSIVDDVDLKRNKLESFAQLILRDVLSVARAGVLVEYPRVEQAPATLAQAQVQNLRPYASYYPSESIINWKEERINNILQPTLIVLKEMASVAVDAYESKQVDQWRELVLENGAYMQKIWQQETKQSKPQLIETIVPVFKGKPLNFIPFYAFGSEENTLCLNDAPLLPLADLNLAHYRVTADYEHGCHYTGLPMLFLAGVQLDDGAKVYLGSQSAVVTNNDNAKASFVEFTGQGLGALEKNLANKERQMSVIGARMLEEQSKVGVSEETYLMRASGETSALASIAMLISDQLTNMLTFMAQWAGVNSQVTVGLNTDYMPTPMTAQQLAALVASWQSGALSKAELFLNLQRGEVISQGKSFDEHEGELENEPPQVNDIEPTNT